MKRYLIVLLTLFIYTCSDDPAAPKEGCISSTACNYDMTAAVDDGSCLEPGSGECCTDDNQVSTPDCADTCGGTAVEDCAGTCSGPGVADGNGDCCASGTLDCAGTCDGTAVADCAGTCNGTAVADCAGTCGGTAVNDDCGVCDGGNATQDCAGTCDGTAVEDCAGTCNGTAVADCAGTCNGTAVADCAGTCNGTAVADCAGTCGGTAVNDDCGVCDGDGSSCASLACADLTTLCADATDCNTLALNTTTGDVYYNFTDDIAGVQFNIVGGTASSASGGAAAGAGWILNAAGATVLGFSFSNATIDWDPNSATGCTGAAPCSGVLFTIAGDIANATGLDTIVATTASSDDATTNTSTDACE